jgi:hypothetical protein
MAIFVLLGVLRGFPAAAYRRTPHREAIVCYYESLITQQMKASGPPFGVKINEKKRTSSFLLFG